ncbi:MBL fold metallo-hydrolase [Thioclava nitratireducens]|uniref:MBL fold metallo-hydrolase n=1 Tax=Thioclava nitratireducens TaxID=1915078 RepID=UPI0024810BA0|nr:MBL fold metallo-hydrolase [Thioclava nitratireducens]WGT50356.1 MBL fold metallo-hydrolase [Thioclava nitratireducens]
MEELQPGLRRIVAPNPSPMTYTGTCTYVIGTGEVAVVDPGPADPAHLQALLDALASGERVSHILVTHAHLDHSPGARLLAEATGAPILAFGPPEAGRAQVMAELAARGHAGGGEGVDHAFDPDILIEDGETLSHGDWSLTALHTPGHFCNHLSFAMGDALLTGDVVMGWSSTLISPPDGDLGDYYRSLARIEELRPRILYPGHGEPVTDPQTLIASQRAHRDARTAQIRSALAERPATPQTLTRAIYTDVPAALLPAAERNVFAHLVEMSVQNEVIAAPDLRPEALFSLT